MTVSSTLHTATTRPLHPMQYPRFHEAAHSVAWRRGITDTSRQGRYHNHRFRTVAEELGLQVERDSAFGWSQTHLRASTVAAYSGVLGELEHHVPRAAASGNGSQRGRNGITTLACQCGARLVRDGGGRFLAKATICSGCLHGPRRALNTECDRELVTPNVTASVRSSNTCCGPRV
jgi:hypothetical protein